MNINLVYKKTIINPYSFGFSQNLLYTINELKELSCLTSQDLQIAWRKDGFDFGCLYTLDNLVVFQSYLGFVKIFNHQGEQVELTECEENCFFSSSINGDTNIFIINNKDSEGISYQARLCEYDNDKRKISAKAFDIRGNARLLNREYLIVSPNDYETMELFEVKTESRKWIVNLSILTGIEFIKTREILGCIADQLLVTINDRMILSLSMLNGKIEKIWSVLPDDAAWQIHSHHSPSTVIPGVHKCVLDSDSEKIIGLSTWFYWEIDLESGAITFHDLRQSFERNRLHCSHTSKTIIKNEHIFFVSDALLYDSDTPFYLAAFNRTTRKIDWRYEFPVGLWLAPQTLQMSGNLLAVADLQNTLHLFERT